MIDEFVASEASFSNNSLQFDCLLSPRKEQEVDILCSFVRLVSHKIKRVEISIWSPSTSTQREFVD